MKIVFLIDGTSLNSLGGAEMVAYGLAKKIQKDNHQVFVLTTVLDKKKDGIVNLDSIKVFQIYANYHPRWRSYLSLYNPQTVKRVDKILKQIKPDIVHAHNIHSYLSYHCLKIARKHSKAVFLTTHDVMSVHYGKWLPKNKRDLKITVFDQIKLAQKRYNPFRNLIIKKYLKHLDKIFAVSQSLKKILMINGINNIETVYNGIDTKAWHQDDEALIKFREKYNLANKKVVLFGGRINEDKGGQIILKSLAQAVEKIPQAILLIIGKKNKYVQEMIKLANDLQIEDKLVFTDWLDKQELKTAYYSSQLCVVPSLCFESFNLVCLEAMAAKKPVIASYFGGPSEIIVDNKTGYLVNPYQIDRLTKKIIDLLSSPEKSKQFGKNGFARASQVFSIEKQAIQTINWYKKCLR